MSILRKENNMKLIIAGGRTFSDYNLLRESVDRLREEHPDIDTVVSGTARGADKLGERYAYSYGLDIVSMPADWNTHGLSAGYKRNKQMAEVADACICFWDGKSKGTGHMIDLAKEYDILKKVVLYN